MKELTTKQKIDFIDFAILYFSEKIEKIKKGKKYPDPFAGICWVFAKYAGLDLFDFEEHFPELGIKIQALKEKAGDERPPMYATTLDVKGHTERIELLTELKQDLLTV